MGLLHSMYTYVLVVVCFNHRKLHANHGKLLWFDHTWIRIDDRHGSRIGQGGMGSVYPAKLTDAAPSHLRDAGVEFCAKLVSDLRPMAPGAGRINPHDKQAEIRWRYFLRELFLLGSVLLEALPLDFEFVRSAI